MPSTKYIRRRIRVVKNIEKITSAMKMVAAARLRRAQDRAESARPYADKMREVMASLAANVGEIQHPLLEVREEHDSAFVIIGADRGLAGSYNVNVMHRALREIGERDPQTVKLVLVGKKAVSYFRSRPYQTVAEPAALGSDITFADIRGLTTRVRSMFESGEVDAVYIVYAKFISAMRQDPTVTKLLPVSPQRGAAQAEADFIFEPEADQLLGRLLPRYVDTQLYQALVESNASEQGARMTAMSAATKNAGEMIDNLTLQYHKARQQAITREIVEIVSGAEALK
jgi:F-type H+-transporting ATPase subunit gamma